MRKLFKSINSPVTNWSPVSGLGYKGSKYKFVVSAVVVVTPFLSQNFTTLLSSVKTGTGTQKSSNVASRNRGEAPSRTQEAPSRTQDKSRKRSQKKENWAQPSWRTTRIKACTTSSRASFKEQLLWKPRNFCSTWGRCNFLEFFFLRREILFSMSNWNWNRVIQFQNLQNLWMLWMLGNAMHCIRCIRCIRAIRGQTPETRNSRDQRPIRAGRAGHCVQQQLLVKFRGLN